MDICILASGSSGNCIYVAAGSTRILVDAGLSPRETGLRLAQSGVALADISAVCLTHEHSDHCAGLKSLLKRFQLPVYANEPTARTLEYFGGLSDSVWTIFRTGEAFSIGDLRLEPFAVSHDAAETVGFVIADKLSDARLGIATDIGAMTNSARERLRACDVVILESNHDPQMVRASSRPWSVKQRILGPQGHLSNEAAAETLIDLAGGRCRIAYLAHLSEECNTADLAMREVARLFASRGIAPLAVHRTWRDRICEPLTFGNGAAQAPPRSSGPTDAARFIETRPNRSRP